MAMLHKVKGFLFAVLVYLSSSLGIIFFAGWCLPIVFFSRRLFRAVMDFHVGFWFNYAATPYRWRYVCCSVMVCTSLVGTVFLPVYSIPTLLTRPDLFRELGDQLFGSSIVFFVALLELFLGIKIVITGDEIRHGERNLLIMNHRTRLDWMYLWSVLVRMSGVKTEKIILKAPLKLVPGAGWAMQSAALIFIKRKWEEDKVYLTKMLNYFAAIKYKTQVLLFPEGTDMTPKTKVMSDRFAEKNGLQTLEYVLHPRTTGFTFLVQHMRSNSHLDAVYDISIAYPFNFPQNEPELLLGNFPREVHFHIRRHAADSLPHSEEQLATWCQQVWQEKEAALKTFYASETKRFPGEQIQDKCTGNRNPQVTLWVAAVFWTSFVFGILFLLYWSWLARWIAIFQCLFHLYMSHRGGFELFQAELYERWTGIAKKST